LSISSIINLIGDTPLIRLNRLSDATGCEILGKAEFLNPGQSIKDRAALSIVQKAKASGALRRSGGTLAGVGAFLRERNPAVKIALADPAGASLFNWFTQGQMTSEGSSITEGIGVARITGNLEGFTPDFSYRIEDAEFLPVLFDLVTHEGLSLGGSSGVNLAGAVRLARDLGPGKTIVTVLCDPGTRYASRLFNPAFLRSKGLPTPQWVTEDVRELA